MRRNHVDIAIADAIAILGCAALFVHLPGPAMIVLGLALFAIPGYVWSEVFLGPDIEGLERVAIAIGLALMVPVFGGLGLYAARIPLHRAAWTGLFAIATLAGTAVVLLTRRTPEEEPRQETKRKRWSAWHAVAFGLAAVIATGAVGLAVVSAKIQKYPGYTQLWLSPLPANPDTASLGVTNQQGGTIQYRLVLKRKGRVSATWNLTMTNGQTWQHDISFTDSYPIVADLYKLPDLSHPYRNVDNGS